jgi:hypothetical protein
MRVRTPRPQPDQPERPDERPYWVIHLEKDPKAVEDFTLFLQQLDAETVQRYDSARDDRSLWNAQGARHFLKMLVARVTGRANDGSERQTQR